MSIFYNSQVSFNAVKLFKPRATFASHHGYNFMYVL